jgi:hypothetical protein
MESLESPVPIEHKMHSMRINPLGKIDTLSGILGVPLCCIPLEANPIFYAQT